MGSGKVAPPPSGVPSVETYRDDDAASNSSAVLLEDFDYPEDEPPAYTDEPAAPGFDQAQILRQYGTGIPYHL
jgi:hypothetical protein